MRHYFVGFLLMAALLVGCRNASPEYTIGVSQCVGGSWREKVNQEMRSAQHLYNNVVKVDIVSAEGDSKRQVAQIDSLADAGVDLLVISPNEYKAITPAIERAWKRGIPIVLFDRKVDTNHYTAYIGGDNVEAGTAMGHYALSILHERSYDHRPRILEITGGNVSSPAIDRHKGFASVVKDNPEVEYDMVVTDWSSEQTYSKAKSYFSTHPTPDIVFCHSDLAARNAYKAAKELHLEKGIRFLGIDGLPGKGEGIDNVETGMLAGTYIYPTHGEQIVRLALDILQGKPYKHENTMRSVIVTPDNASVIMQSSMEMKRQSDNLLTLQDKLDKLFGAYNMQRTMLIVGVVAIVLLVVAIILIWRVVVITRRVNRKEKQLNKEQTLFYTNARHQLRTPLTLIEGPLGQLAASSELNEHDRSLVDILQRNVGQLSRIVYDVLNFRNDTPPAVDDFTVATAQEKDASDEQIKQGHLEMLTNSNDAGLPTILVVDDNADMRRYLRTLLTDRYYVIESTDGESGLKLARESVPDLIVSDVMMPVMDGLQFCRKIKDDTMTSHIPVILLTARSTEEQRVEGLGSGADAYITKPFNAKVLMAQMDSLLKNRRQLREHFAKDQYADGGALTDTFEPAMTTPDKQFMDALRKAIDKNMGNSKLKMDDIGADLGISRVQLYRKVKALTGMSPVELLRLFRLQRAYKLLQSTNKTVAEVSYEVGFGTPGYFSSCFKKQYGKYPTELKREDE